MPRPLASILVYVAVATGCMPPLPSIPDPVAQNLIVTAAVKTALLNDLKVYAARVDVETVGGVVTLSGVVPSKTREERAIELARGTEGVIDVKSYLRVDASCCGPGSDLNNPMETFLQPADEPKDDLEEHRRADRTTNCL
jgi:hypothetical protein